MKKKVATKHDTKLRWKVISRILKPNSKSKSEFKIEKEGITITNGTVIASGFITISAQSLTRQIPDPGVDLKIRDVIRISGAQ